MTFVGDVRRDRPFTIDAAHDGVDTVSYKLLLNGTVYAEQPVAALANGRISFTVPGLPKGTYELIIAAVGEAGDEVGSAPFGLAVVAAPPAPPTDLRVVQP